MPSDPKTLPFRRVPEGYQASCAANCGKIFIVRTAQRLPHDVISQKLEKQGMIGSGHHSKGVPARLECEECFDKRRREWRERNLQVKPVDSVTEESESMSIIKPLERKPKNHAELVREALNAGINKPTDIQKWIFAKHSEDVPMSSIYQEKSRLTKETAKKQVRSELGPIDNLQQKAQEFKDAIKAVKDAGYLIQVREVTEEGELIGFDISLDLSIR